MRPAKDIKFADVPNGLAALGKARSQASGASRDRFEAIRCISQVPLTGWIQIILFCGMVDFGLYRADESRDPGDYEPLGPRHGRLQQPRNAGILGVPNASGPMSDVEGRKRWAAYA